MSEAEYQGIERDFRKYLRDTSEKNGVCLLRRGEEVSFVCLDYGHRWSRRYAKRFFYRMYLLENWFRWQSRPVTFVTLTTAHDDSIPDQIVMLKEGFRKFLKELRKFLPGVQYIANMDFHETGYGHVHMLVFSAVSENLQTVLREYWLRWGMGSRRHGLDFRVRGAGEIEKLTAYLFRHAGKIFSGGPGWLRFHSCIWYMYHDADFPCVRLFSVSREIAKVMRVGESEFECLGFAFSDGSQYRQVFAPAPFPEEQWEKDVADIEKFRKWFDALKF